jgi:hypothetical protein
MSLGLTILYFWEHLFPSLGINRIEKPSSLNFKLNFKEIAPSVDMSCCPDFIYEIKFKKNSVVSPKRTELIIKKMIGLQLQYHLPVPARKSTKFLHHHHHQNQIRL